MRVSGLALVVTHPTQRPLAELAEQEARLLARLAVETEEHQTTEAPVTVLVEVVLVATTELVVRELAATHQPMAPQRQLDRAQEGVARLAQLMRQEAAGLVFTVLGWTVLEAYTTLKYKAREVVAVQAEAQGLHPFMLMRQQVKRVADCMEAEAAVMTLAGRRGIQTVVKAQSESFGVQDAPSPTLQESEE